MYKFFAVVKIQQSWPIFTISILYYFNKFHSNKRIPNYKINITIKRKYFSCNIFPNKYKLYTIYLFFFFSVSPAKFAYNVSFTSFYLILIHFMEMYIRLQNKYHQPTKTNHASIDSLVERYIRGNVLRSNWSTFELTMRKNKL